MNREAEKENLIKSLESIISLLKKESVALRSSKGSVNVSIDVNAEVFTGNSLITRRPTGYIGINIDQCITLFDQEMMDKKDEEEL